MAYCTVGRRGRLPARYGGQVRALVLLYGGDMPPLGSSRVEETSWAKAKAVAEAEERAEETKQ